MPKRLWKLVLVLLSEIATRRPFSARLSRFLDRLLVKVEA